MKFQARSLAVAIAGIAPVLLAAGCGSGETGARTTLANIQATSYVTVQPEPTTTTTVATTVAIDGVSSTTQSYTVVSGDSVYKIAGIFDVDPEALANFNEWDQGVFHPLQVGDIVEIPPGASIAGAPSSNTDTAAPVTEAPAVGQGCTHVIVLNENPSKVANKYDLTVDELRAANAGNPAMTSFIVGQTLSIPPNGSC